MLIIDNTKTNFICLNKYWYYYYYLLHIIYNLALYIHAAYDSCLPVPRIEE